MNVNEINLKRATQIHAIANTPLFLVRKLQADPAVRQAADSISGEEIVQALRTAVTREPVSAEDAVRPYVLLVALWFSPKIAHLQEAAKLETSIYSWYSYIAEALLTSFSAVQQQIIKVPAQVSPPTVCSSSPDPVNRILIVP